MRDVTGFAAACLMAAVAPWLGGAPGPAAAAAAAWDATLVPAGARVVPLSEDESRHLARFPGAVARYVDGEEAVLVRRVHGASRALHSSAECLRAAGFDVVPGATRLDPTGRAWGGGTARRAGITVTYRERITCDDGTAFPDVTGWYWHALASGEGLVCTATTRSH
ncbi:MAG: hypothetical protein HY904_14355 [Deltaproteobacteria bacterium]|nr:hypothetical protein [Deltaproteobacteria bacterium]